LERLDPRPLTLASSRFDPFWEDKTCKDDFESFRFLLIGYSKAKCRLKFWTESIVQMFQEQLILPVQTLFESLLQETSQTRLMIELLESCAVTEHWFIRASRWPLIKCTNVFISFYLAFSSSFSLFISVHHFQKRDMPCMPLPLAMILLFSLSGHEVWPMIPCSVHVFRICNTVFITRTKNTWSSLWGHSGT